VDDYELLIYTEVCLRCGIAGAQRSSFRFHSEPKARHSDFLQLNWVFDEFFVTPEVRSDLEAAGLSGVGFLPAVLHRKGVPLQTRLQLQISTILPLGVDTRRLQPVTCRPRNEEWSKASQKVDDAARAAGAMKFPSDYPYCGRVKHHHPQSAPLQMKRSSLEGAPDIAKTQEWFGSGGAADRKIVCSDRFVDLARTRGWRGIQFEELVVEP
jgi:hypothetical protein